MNTYDSKTASRIVGVSLRQLQYWDEQDFIRPSVKPAEGRGTKRLYSFQDLICIRVVKDLAHHGFTLQKIRRCLRPLKENSSQTEHLAESLKYLTDGEELFVVSLGIGNLVRELDFQAKRVELGPRRKRAKAQRADGKTSGIA